MTVITWPPPGGGERITVVRHEVILSNVICAIQQQTMPPPDYKAWLLKPANEIIVGDIVRRHNNRTQPEMPETIADIAATVVDNSQLKVVGVRELDSFSDTVVAPVLSDPFDVGTPDSPADIFIELDLNKTNSDDPDSWWRQILSSRRTVVSEVERYYRDGDGRNHKVTTRIHEEFDESYGDWVRRKMEVFFDVVGGSSSADYHHNLIVDPQWELVSENWTKFRVPYDRSMEVDPPTVIPGAVIEVDETRTGIPGGSVIKVDETGTVIPVPVEVRNPYNDYMRMVQQLAQQQAEEEEELTLEKD